MCFVYGFNFTPHSIVSPVAHSTCKDDTGLTVRKLLDDWKLDSMQISRFCSMVCESRLLSIYFVFLMTNRF